MVPTVLINTVNVSNQCLVSNNPTDVTTQIDQIDHIDYIDHNNVFQSVSHLRGAHQVQHMVTSPGHVVYSSIENKILDMTVDDGQEHIRDGATRAMLFAIAVSKLENIFGRSCRTSPAPLPQPQQPSSTLDPSTVQSDPIIPPTTTTTPTTTTIPNHDGIVYGHLPTGPYETWELPDGTGYYDDGSGSTWEETPDWSFPIEYVQPTEYPGSFTTSSGSNGSTGLSGSNGSSGRRSERARIEDRSWDSIIPVTAGSRSERNLSSTSSQTHPRSPESTRRRVEGSKVGWLRWMRRRGDELDCRERMEMDESDRKGDENESVGCWGSWKRRVERNRERSGRGGNGSSRRIRRWIGKCWK